MKSIITLTACATILLPLISTSCREKGEVVHTKVAKTPAPAPPSSASPHQGKTKTANTATGNTTTKPKQTTAKATYTWTLPKGWSDKPASGMRLGTIIIPNGDATLSGGIFEFGGDLIGNVNRWRQQVGLPESTETEILPSLTTFDSPLGKEGKGYIVTLINPATPDNSMLAAIIPRPSGTSVFVKITGKSDELKAIAAPFLTFTQSLK